MKYLYLCCILIFINSNAQILHHQAIMSQAKEVLTSSGYVLSQSIGQNSASGTFKSSNLIVQQGFQQYAIDKYNINTSSITTKVFPNPFISFLNFEFSQTFNDEVEISLYNLTGALITTIYKKPKNNIVNINLENIPNGQYIVTLNVGYYNFSTKIIKN